VGRPKVHLVHYPLKGWEIFNLAITCDNDAPRPAAGIPISKEEVHKHFMHIAPRARQIIDYGEDWKYWVLCDREPIENWVDGRATLLGDAAHPMLQYMAQGACMALEDGVFLAHAVAQFPNEIPRSLIFYNNGRVVRTARVQMGSRLMGQYVFHVSGAMATVRNATLRSKTQTQHCDDLAWLYQGQPLPPADDPNPRL
jgi:3-hydroxybenzoate 6-monooxygenase